MLDKATFCCCWKQVELNTIASGFGWMGPASGMIHRLVSCLVPQHKFYFPNNTSAFKHIYQTERSFYHGEVILLTQQLVWSIEMSSLNILSSSGDFFS